MSYFIDFVGNCYVFFGEGGGVKIVDMFGMVLFGQVLFILEICVGGDSGVFIVVSQFDSFVVCIFCEIGEMFFVCVNKFWIVISG